MEAPIGDKPAVGATLDVVNTWQSKADDYSIVHYAMLYGLEPGLQKSEKCVFIGYPKETVGYTFYHRSEGKIFVAKNGSFLEKEFLSKEVSGRKVELDEVIVPSLKLDSSTLEKSVSRDVYNN